MDAEIRAQLDWIAAQQGEMEKLTEQGSAMNSGSYNLAGLRSMREALAQQFAVLEGAVEVIPLSPITQINARGEVIEVPGAIENDFKITPKQLEAVVDDALFTPLLEDLLLRGAPNRLFAAFGSSCCRINRIVLCHLQIP